MAPSGRQRASSPWNIILAFLFFFTTSASAAVLGLDFGTLNLKASLVKPGIPLEIVLTKDSKRKEAAAVAFKPTRDSSNNVIAELGTYPERAYGGDALSLQGRMPSEVFPNLKPLVGLPWNGEQSESVRIYKSRYPAVQATQDEKLGTTFFKSGAFNEAEEPWSVEELLAMELSNVKNNAESMAGNAVEDTVITVPAFYTADEKRAIEKAADLAGLNVMSLISDGLAVGLDYAKSRTFPTVNDGGKPEQHIVFDMGAGSATATVLRFQSRKVKDVGKFNKTVQEVAVLGTGWDRTLGGDSLNQVIVDDYINKFVTKPVLKSRGIQAEELGQNGRLMSRVWKDAEKARHVLSANSETHSFFEELLPEIDFKTKLTRADFEALASDYADRVAGPLKDALDAAKLTMKDIDSVILHGGAVRTPFVQRKLEEFVGKADKLRSNVNADESAVFGAAFKGAGLSPSFKVKEIRDSDVAGYPAGITFNDGGKDRRQGLFTITSPVGNGASTKQVSFKNKEDFDFGLYQQVGEADHAIASIQTTNLTASVAALKDRFGCEKDDVSTKFSVRLSAIDGIPEVVSGTVSCETDQAAKGGSVGDSVKGWLGFGKKEQEPLEGEEGTETTEEVEASIASSTATESASSASASSSAVPEKPKKRTESITVAFTTTPKGLPQSSPAEIKRMRERLAAFDRSDKARYAREEALNILESYTYYVRDFLDNSDYSPVSTSSQRDEIAKLLTQTKEWMEEPKEIAKATEKALRDRLSGLKKLVEPIKQRRTENEGREDKVSALKESLEQTNKLLENVREEVQKAEEEASKSASSAASSTTAPPDPDNLEDDEETSTTSSAKATPYAFSPYTNEDLTSISKIYTDVTAWLEEKLTAQNKLAPHEEPALTIKDLEAKAAKLSEAMLELVQKKIRQPKPSSSSSKKPKSKTSKAGKKSKATSSATSSSAGDEAPEAEQSGGPKIVKMEPGEDGEMPSEEEILRMVKEAQGEKGEKGHDEL